jgi:lipocalin
MVNATLSPTTTSGRYIEKIGPNSVGYWVIHLDEQYAVTYDCNTVSGITNYCIHILSKNPHADLDTIHRLAKIALDLGLNKNNLSIEITNQSDQICQRTETYSFWKNLNLKNILRK